MRWLVFVLAMLLADDASAQKLKPAHCVNGWECYDTVKECLANLKPDKYGAGTCIDRDVPYFGMERACLAFDKALLCDYSDREQCNQRAEIIGTYCTSTPRIMGKSGERRGL